MQKLKKTKKSKKSNKSKANVLTNSQQAIPVPKPTEDTTVPKDDEKHEPAIPIVENHANPLDNKLDICHDDSLIEYEYSNQKYSSTILTNAYFSEPDIKVLQEKNLQEKDAKTAHLRSIFSRKKTTRMFSVWQSI